MKTSFILLIMLLLLVDTSITAQINNQPYYLIYVSVDDDSDLNSIADRVNLISDEAKKSNSGFLLYISRGNNPILTYSPDQASSKINEIFRFGTKPPIYVDQEIQSLLKSINIKDFAVLGPNYGIKYLTTKIRFHFIISKQFIAMNYQEIVIGTLLSCCNMDKVKEQNSNFTATIYLGKNHSAKGLLDKVYPLGMKYLSFAYSNFLTDDNY